MKTSSTSAECPNLNKSGIIMSHNSSSFLRDYLMSQYCEMENNYSPSGNTVGTYNTPVNFTESLETPRHRWYGYKEGFSPSFVRDFIQKHTDKSNPIIFDPFGGVGTTGLEANILGYNAYLMDVNPLGIFASEVKTTHYDSDDIKKTKNEVRKLQNISDYPILTEIPNDTITRYFDSTTWEALLKIKSYIEQIRNKRTKNLFVLAMLSLIEEISTHHKNGNGVKRKRKVPTVCTFEILRNKLTGRINVFLEDIANRPISGETTILKMSNLCDYELPQKADIVLTSPPYANCFDYSKVYLSELWIGGFFSDRKDQKLFRENSMISHVHFKWEPRYSSFGSKLVNDVIAPLLQTKNLWSNNIIPMLIGYFSDMGRFLSNLTQNVSPGATIGIVVGNSVYGGVPIATDLIVAKQAEELGFRCQEIKIYRRVIASSQQMVLLSENEKKYVRESLIVLEWTKKEK